MVHRLSKLFTTFWPFGLLAFFVLIILSFTHIPAEQVAQIFGLTVVACAAMAWLVSDYVGSADNRVHSKLKELEDLLKPYDGMKLKEMPPEVQEAVRAKLGWTEKPKPAPAESRPVDKVN